MHKNCKFTYTLSFYRHSKLCESKNTDCVCVCRQVCADRYTLLSACVLVYILSGVLVYFYTYIYKHGYIDQTHFTVKMEWKIVNQIVNYLDILITLRGKKVNQY